MESPNMGNVRKTTGFRLCKTLLLAIGITNVIFCVIIMAKSHRLVAEINEDLNDYDVYDGDYDSDSDVIIPNNGIITRNKTTIGGSVITTYQTYTEYFTVPILVFIALANLLAHIVGLFGVVLEHFLVTFMFAGNLFFTSFTTIVYAAKHYHHHHWHCYRDTRHHNHHYFWCFFAMFWCLQMCTVVTLYMIDLWHIRVVAKIERKQQQQQQQREQELRQNSTNQMSVPKNLATLDIFNTFGGENNEKANEAAAVATLAATESQVIQLPPPYYILPTEYNS